MKSQGCLIHAIEFDYGQTHIKELRFAEVCAIGLGLERTKIELHKH